MAIAADTSTSSGTFLNPAVYAAGPPGGETIAGDATRAGLGAWARSRSMNAPIGVYIVSRNRLFADALASLLARTGELTVIGVAQDPEDLALASDVLLIDADGFAPGPQDPAAAPGAAGSPAPDRALVSLRHTFERGAACKAMVFGVKSEDERLIDLIEAGAKGYVLEGASPAELVEAIRAVHAGSSRCSSQVAAAVVARIQELEARQVKVERYQGEPLTAREREVLRWIATGRGNKEIGRRLGISVQTVKNHVHSLLTKLGARRRREALRIAYELGVLTEWGDTAKDL
jgi:DNA-binding NarL/FixJ family response regulator